MDAKYQAILHAKRSQSRHIPMPLEDRAAQFAPFAALTGHAEGAAETARITQGRIELSDDAIVLLEQQMNLLASQIENHLEIIVTYFMADALKTGGAYATETRRIKRIDDYQHTFVMADGTVISVGDIVLLDL